VNGLDPRQPNAERDGMTIAWLTLAMLLFGTVAMLVKTCAAS
jgi:hypothetical protein